MNKFELMKKVSRLLKKKGYKDKINEYTSKVLECESYEEALSITNKILEKWGIEECF